MIMRDWSRKLAIVGLFALGAAAGLFALPSAENFLPIGFAPVYFRAFVWSTAYSFALGLAGGSLFLLVRMGVAQDTLLRFALYGLALGMVVFSFSDMSRGGNERIAWYGTGGKDRANLIAFDREVQARALAEGKPIFYYFRADWCDICPDFERNVLPRVAGDTEPFLAVKMDITDFERWHPYLHGVYGVEATPTVVLRDRNGQLLTGTHFTGEHVSIRALQAALHTLGR